MNKPFTAVRATALVLALIGIGFATPTLAQGSSAGVQSPSSGGNEVSPRSGPLPGKDSISTIPDKATPRSDTEVGPQTPPEHSTVTPPPGSAKAPNPKTPKTVNEAAGSGPDITQGGTAGSTGTGTTGRSRDPSEIRY